MSAAILNEGDELRFRLSFNAEIKHTIADKRAANVVADLDEVTREAKIAAREKLTEIFRDRYGINFVPTDDSKGWHCPNEGCLFNHKGAIVR